MITKWEMREESSFTEFSSVMVLRGFFLKVSRIGVINRFWIEGLRISWIEGLENSGVEEYLDSKPQCDC